MAKLTTHILDATHGRPAAGVRIVLSRVLGAELEFITEARTNDDGRTDAPILAEAGLGVYQLDFYIGDYFRTLTTLPTTPFLDVVPIRFGIGEDAHYHVPLLASPYSYSTYRGS